MRSSHSGAVIWRVPLITCTYQLMARARCETSLGNSFLRFLMIFELINWSIYSSVTHFSPKSWIFEHSVPFNHNINYIQSYVGLFVWKYNNIPLKQAIAELPNANTLSSRIFEHKLSDLLTRTLNPVIFNIFSIFFCHFLRN